ncbi:hypothetical protein LOTGIDRAFT_233430 [Lottia gigantea]|uniref:CARD domain-containing protein n=1 Tax=Lottia gigantea TaxID=225164 RepID=V4AE83_LOTGI|nr:hypothetical protein LOTGIDRAFT_233430 [Lottia gigantea]ESO91656.1 hypothetical protein LOTGIDRAFT_233430 [Lottia gigantea]
MADNKIQIPNLSKEDEAVYRELLLVDLVDLQDIKQKRKRKSYRVKVESYLDRIHQNNPNALLICYAIDVLANIVKPQYQEPLFREAENLFHKLVADLQNVKPNKKRKRSRAEIEKYLETGPEDRYVLFFVADIVMPEYKELILKEARASLQRQLEDIEPKKRRKRKQKRKKPRVEEEKENDGDFERSEKSGVEPRVKTPNWHETLRKNYPSIMENVRVKDIVDHLYSKQLIDWDEMDVINTKLRSAGNREALTYLMKILLNSTQTILPSFLHCLNQTGYDFIANCLKDDMKPNDVNDVDDMKSNE